MKPPLIIDHTDTKWLLLEKILDVTTANRAKQEMARQGITPITNAGSIFRILLVAIFFSCDIAYVIDELHRRRDLRSFAHIDRIPSADEVYRFLSEIDEPRFVALINALLRTLAGTPKRRDRRTILIDGSAITLDRNVVKKRIRKADLDEKDYRWGYSTTQGYYLGFKLTLAIDYPSLVPVAFLIHPGSPHDSRLFSAILTELKRRRIIRDGDTVIADKGYYAYENYVRGVTGFKIVPLIFPKKGFNASTLAARMNYPLSLFSAHEYRRRQGIYKRCLRDLLRHLGEWEDFRAPRSRIEDIFKLAKDAFSLRDVHRYSRRSVGKFVAVTVLLVGAVIASGIHEKNEIQSLAEW